MFGYMGAIGYCDLSSALEFYKGKIGVVETDDILSYIRSCVLF
jgi:hypothetical protein